MSGIYFEQPFLKHFIDSIALCEMAESLPLLSMSRHTSLARASIMSAAFSLEAAANSLMAPIEAPKRIIQLIDQGQVIDKYEFVLFGIQPTKTFDRGASHVQSIQELFGIRNQFVHPRTRKRVITHRELDERTITIEKGDSRSNHLDLPASPEDWGSADALRVLKASSDFLDYFVLDLCEADPEILRRILISTVEVEDKTILALSEGQRTVLARAIQRWPLAFRLVRVLLKLENEEPQLTQRLVFSYSCGVGGMQLHNQRKTIEVEGSEVTTELLMDSVQRFLLWFWEAEQNARGRRLLSYEIHSSEGEGRYATFRTFLTDWIKKPENPNRLHRPVGKVTGVEKQLYFNRVVGLTGDSETPAIVVVDESGNGRELRFSSTAAQELVQAVIYNKREGWAAEKLAESKPEVVETKGADYDVVSVEIVTYDPTSRTAFITWRGESNVLLQANMKPSTLMTIFHLLASRLSTLRPEEEPADDHDSMAAEPDSEANGGAVA